MTQRNGITAGELAILSAPTPAEEVKQRHGHKMHQGDCEPPRGTCRLAHALLDYIDARFVMDRLDQIGPEFWQDAYVDRADGSVRAGIGVLIDGEWVWKWDVGDPSDIEANKGAYSEAFKRAGVKWGIARDLYGHAPSKSPAAHSPAATAPSPAAGRSTPRPAADTLPEEPEWMAPSSVEAARSARGGTQNADSEASCPVHGKPWREGKRGFYCATKNADDSWCDEHPTQRWVTARGAVAAGR